jgi:hypothetical protein
MSKYGGPEKNGLFLGPPKKRPQKSGPEKTAQIWNLKMAFFRTWKIRSFLTPNALDISHFYIFYWGYI